jgi:uncharacterized small protein (DUF1192 family)
MTADDVRRMYHETMERAPALPRYSVFHRECVAVLLLEIDRLKAGRFKESDSVHDSVQRLFTARKK